eukprot:COSAG01_NODE_57245_length_313_cov_1.088785_1_plen_55_part_00
METPEGTAAAAGTVLAARQAATKRAEATLAGASVTGTLARSHSLPLGGGWREQA